MEGAGGHVGVGAGRVRLDHLLKTLQDERGQGGVQAERIEISGGAARHELQLLQRASHLEGGERQLRVGLQDPVEVAGEDAGQVGAQVEEG